MMKTNDEWKEEIKKQWNTTPCGEGSGDQQTLEYFLSLERHRYEKYAPWMKDFFRFSGYCDKKVLEVGYGQGTDLCQFAAAGSDCYGIDLTDEHFKLASRNLQLRGLRAELLLGDANALTFDDNTFDVVYTFGVLHHTPDTIRCLSEAYRVLKPGGELIVSLYHKHSVFYWLNLLLGRGILKGKLYTLGYSGLLSTIEHGADGVNIKPLVKLYTRRTLRTILSDFHKVSIYVRHLDGSHFPVIGRLIPLFVIRLLEPMFGWYVIARAIK